MRLSIRQIYLTAQGFSMIELMVVVSVIGILAIIGIPQYEKFKAKARRAEMKTNLSAVYVASKGFNAEYSGYSSNMKIIGFGHIGKVLYNIEFLWPCTDWDVCAPEFNGDRALNLPQAFSSSMDICYSSFRTSSGWAPTLAESGCEMTGDGTIFYGPGPIRSIVAGRVVPGIDNITTTQFAVAASAYIIDNAFSHDVWRIDQTKVMTQRSDGMR